MSEWHRVERKYTPCDNCEVGWCSTQQKVENRELYAKVDDCHATCKRYRQWLENPSQFLLDEGIVKYHNIYKELAKC